MNKNEIDQLFLDPEAFIKKVVELASKKDVEKPFDEFIIELIHCGYPNLFEKLLDMFSASIWMTASADIEAMANMSVDLEDETPIQKVEGKDSYVENMKAFLIAFEDFEVEELK